MRFVPPQQKRYQKNFSGFVREHKWGISFLLINVICVFSAVSLFKLKYLGNNIYWESSRKPPFVYQGLVLEGFRVINESWKETDPLEFSFRIYAPHDNIITPEQAQQSTVLIGKSLEDANMPDAIFFAGEAGVDIDIVRLGMCGRGSRNMVVVKHEGLPKKSSFNIQLLRSGADAPLSAHDIVLRLGDTRLPEKAHRSIFLKHRMLTWVILAFLVSQFFFMSLNHFALKKATEKERGLLISEIYGSSVRSAKRDADSMLDFLSRKTNV